MDDQKKKLALIAIVVLALIAAGVSITKSTSSEQGKAVGSLEEGINKENGLPLNPPPNPTGAASANPAGAAPNDPSMPK
ncbi:MAG: hypothetical protein JNM85_07125 [Chthonomonas sp.]|nr:hypothetical protein [Chthonomonas sp.]